MNLFITPQYSEKYKQKLPLIASFDRLLAEECQSIMDEIDQICRRPAAQKEPLQPQPK